ncbi:polyisoprenoid-binding protein [Bryobacterales bacterium F-183]|nr:polyisoprenoid-binding protein [Bryobacterales bacterium F-183]
MKTFALFTLAAAAVVSASAATYTIDTSHSSAGFKVRHLMISNVKGEFTKTTGTVTFDPKNLAASSVDATIDVSTISTREERRDAHLKSPDFFDVAKFPTMTFKSTKFEAAGAGKYKVTGNLTLHGVTKPVVLELSNVTPETKGMQGETRIGGQATTKINRKDFGLTWSKTMDGGGAVVGDEVDITLDLELVKK